MAAKVRNHNDWLPLHFACRNGASFSIIKMLKEAYPEAVKMKNNEDEMPAQIALRNDVSIDTIKMLLEYLPKSVANIRTDEDVKLFIEEEDIGSSESEANNGTCDGSSSLDIPPELKEISVYLQQAKELDREQANSESQIVSYYCRKYAVLCGLQFAYDSQACKDYLCTILNQLDEEKLELPSFTSKESECYTRKFANIVFTKADNADKAGYATRETASLFHEAASFFDVLQQFITDKEILSEEQEEDRKKANYARSRAVDILVAVNEGKNAMACGYKEHESCTKVVDGNVCDNDLKCTICLEKLLDGVSLNLRLPCGHEFHHLCIRKWQGDSKLGDTKSCHNRPLTCPVCRAQSDVAVEP